MESGGEDFDLESEMAPGGSELQNNEMTVEARSEIQEKWLTHRLTEEEAAEIYRQGEEAVVFALLTLSAKVSVQSSSLPSTPSGMIPVYQKPTTSSRKK